MRLTAEATIDLDERRKVWVQVGAEVGPEDDLEEAAAACAAAATSNAVEAYRQATGRQGAPSDPKLMGMGDG